jgi:hypothetical protein
MMMTTFLRALCVGSLLPIAAMVAAGPAPIKGILIDKKCSAGAEVRVLSTGIEGGLVVAEAHTRECALMAACQKSGYGVFTYDNKFLAFDEGGNKQAFAAIKASKKLGNLEVEVTGEVKGDTIKVANLKMIE